MARMIVDQLVAHRCPSCNLGWFSAHDSEEKSSGTIAHIPDTGMFRDSLVVVHDVPYPYCDQCPRCSKKGEQTIAFNESDPDISTFVPDSLVLCISPSPNGLRRRENT